MTIDHENGTESRFEFDEPELIRLVTEATMESLSCPYEVSVSVSVVTEEEIRRLNREYRGIDRETDVLSFPMNEFDREGIFSGACFEASMTTDPETDELMLGDVILCADRVRSQAEEYGHPEKREYAFLVVHSLLHLCGFDHEEEGERISMEEKQREILDSVGIVR